MTHDPTLLTLDALACFRLTRLLVSDTITQPLRQAVIGTAYAPERDLSGFAMPVAKRPRLAEFVTCPWCMGMWLAGLVVLCQALIPAVWIYAAALLAFSAVAGLLSELS